MCGNTIYIYLRCEMIGIIISMKPAGGGSASAFITLGDKNGDVWGTCNNLTGLVARYILRYSTFLS